MPDEFSRNSGMPFLAMRRLPFSFAFRTTFLLLHVGKLVSRLTSQHHFMEHRVAAGNGVEQHCGMESRGFDQLLPAHRTSYFIFVFFACIKLDVD
jgi:hypothetical protein